MLSRDDNMKASRIEKLDLMTYKQLDFSQMAKDVADENRQKFQQNKNHVESFQEIGFLELMFGGAEN